MADQRLQCLISIRRHPNHPGLVIAALSGGQSAPANMAIRAAAQHAESLSMRLFEVNESFAGRTTKESLAQALVETLVPKIDAEVAKIGAARGLLAQRVAAAMPCEPYGPSLPYWQAMIDSKLIDRIGEMSNGDRAALIARMAFEPWNTRAMTEAVLRWPLEAVPMTQAQRDAARVAALAVFKKDEFAMLKAEMEQLNNAITGVHGIANIVTDVLPSRASWVSHAPHSSRLLSEPLLGWGVEPRVLEAVGQA